MDLKQLASAFPRLGQKPRELSDEDKRRGEAARRVLEDGVFKTAFEDIERLLITAWSSTPRLAHDEREAYYEDLRALRRVRDMLRVYVERGTLTPEEKKRLEANGT